MNEFDLLVDLHKYNLRQGPGSMNVTEKAIELTGLPEDSIFETSKIFAR